MSTGLVFLSILGLMILIAIIQNLRNPPREINFDELPEDVASEIKTLFPEFQPLSVKFIPVSKKYHIKGEYQTHQVRIEAEMTKAGLLDELELKDIENRSTSRGAPINSINEIPEPILKTAFSMLAQNPETPQFIKAYHAKFSNEAGYKLELKQSNHHYEFEITESGRLIEFEKERCH